MRTPSRFLRGRKHRRGSYPAAAVGESLRTLLADVGEAPAAPFVPAAFQTEALEALAQGDVVVCAPTGSGKTWIAERAIDALLERGGTAWYTAPLKALSNQKFRRFQELYGQASVGLLTGERRINAGAPVIVATTEILRNALYDGALVPDLIVLDEAHYLADQERGTAWEEILLLAAPRSRLLLLSATLANVNDLAGWMGEVRGHAPRVVREDVRPVPLRYLFCDARGHLLPPDGLNWLRGDERRPAWLPTLAREMDHRRLLPAIFFFPSRRQCDEAARALAPVRAPGAEARAEALARWEREFPHLLEHPYRWILISAGAAPHHAGHLTGWRLAVEDLLARGLLRIVCATTTLASGLDVPARTVVLSTLVRNSPEGPVSLTATEFHQMTGRAGRRGKDTLGVVVLPATAAEEARQAMALGDAQPEPVRSAFTPGYMQVLNLLAARSLPDALAEIQRSLAMYERRHEVRRLRDLLAAILPDPLEARPCRDRLTTRRTYERLVDRISRGRRALRRESLRGTFDPRDLETRLDGLRRALDSVPCPRCPVESGCLATLEQLRRRERCRSQVVHTLRELQGPLEEDFRRRARVLQALGYLDADFGLTADGRWAARLRHPRALILAEAARRRIIPTRPASIAAFAAALVTERAPRRGGGGERTGEQALARLVEEIVGMERQNGIVPDPVAEEFRKEWDPAARRLLPSPADRRAAVAAAWTSGAAWQPLVANWRVEEGDLQRMLLQAAELLGQIENLPAADVRDAAAAARALLLRPPVSDE